MELEEKFRIIENLLSTYGFSETILKEKTILVPCSFCGDVFEISTRKFINRLYARKFCRTTISCYSEKCKKELKRKIIEEQVRLGKTSAKGHTLSEESKLSG